MPEYEITKRMRREGASTLMPARIQKFPKFLLSQHSANAKLF